MRISKQISGNSQRRGDESRQGRGEYEWCGLGAADPSREQLLGRRIALLIGDVRIDTQCILGRGSSQGKNRVRTAPDAAGLRYIYPHYHLAVALLLPQPTRTEQKLGEGLPLLRTGEYGIIDIDCGRVALDTGPEQFAVVEPIAIRVENQFAADSINVGSRFVQVRQIWGQRSEFEPEISAILEEHEALVRSGGTIAIPGAELIGRLQEAVSLLAADYDELGGIPRNTDPLSGLLRMAGVADSVPINPIDQVPPEAVEIRRRLLGLERLRRVRGPQAAVFHRLVRRLYNSTCVVCGLRLPAISPRGRPGVDAAHILPYSEYDLDRASNGVCLCKLHHWAFDEGIIEIRPESPGEYSVAVPDGARGLASEASLDLTIFDEVVGPIPSTRLPRNPADRPNPDYLRRLHELLYPPD